MRADNKSTRHNRTIKITRIPQEHPDDLTELEIYVNYTGDGNAAKGIALDHHIIPAIVNALNARRRTKATRNG